ncbi:hypothetical protein HYPSUDRAFT_132354 [Hypholoma sublateritium FD-334 SS-4]|uniref:AB hydrolase-1 domain-containing protein n=1 Tax=Hypholoma sublateritium (strain FD-334 SS-4) TaxID=945553 RepID=A0A0D2PE36_HYPSF|nr:hypothetical protein HYPSUDRAFT_132354 [Hypholoma sublateritium FD-334 SS-4]
MLYVDLETSSGPFSFRYSIATPTSHSAQQIAPEIPCILFLHSGYVAQECFEFQFCDANLRQFNLIAVDMRGYGETIGTIGDVQFTPSESAVDVDQIMGKLGLPPCHIFGLSNGCAVALELAIRSPSRVSSLTMCSPPPTKEPEIVSSGHLEVYDDWVLMNLTANGTVRPETDTTYQQMALEVMTGTHQLLYNHIRDDDVIAVARFGLMVGKRNWAGSSEKIKQAYKTSVEWFEKRRHVPFEELKSITMPLSLIHCREDVAYPIEHAKEWEALLIKAGVRVTLHEVPGTHYGSVTNPVEVNTVLYDTVVSCHPQMINKPYIVRKPGQRKLLTPFTQLLVEGVGYSPDSSDSD